MLRVRPYEDADRARWDEYVRGARGAHPGQLTSWKRLTEEQYGCRSRYWLAEDGAGMRGILPLLERRRWGRVRSLFSAPGGLLADDDGVARALLEVASDSVAREQLEFVELRDQLHAWPGLATSEEHCTMWLELAQDSSRQWEVFDAKLRNQIRKGEKSGFSVHYGHENVDDFHRVQLENMRDLGTPIRGEGYYRRVLECLGATAEILVIRLGNEPVGAMFLVVHGDRAADLWASSLRRHFSRCPNQVLYWEAIRWAIGRGLACFDFGRSQWNSSTFHFKQQWGARPVPLHYQYVLGTAARLPTLADQRRTYDLAVQVWKRLPLAVARTMGDPIKRMFPEVV